MNSRIASRPGRSRTNLASLGWAVPGILLGGALACAEPRNLVLDRPVTVDSQHSETSSRLFLNDGNSNRHIWISGPTLPHWAEFVLDDHYLVSGLRIWTGENGAYLHPLTDFRLQHWDGFSWADLRTWADDPNHGVFDATFTPVLAGRRLRLLITAGGQSLGNGAWQAKVYEVEIRGEPNGLRATAFRPSADGSLADPAADLEIDFDQPLQLADPSGVQLRRVTDGQAVAGLGVSLEGSTLRVSHAALLNGESYTLTLTAGVVAPASAPGIVNGPLDYSFEVAPPEPGLATFPETLADPAADLVLEFDRAIALADPTRIFLQDLTDGHLLEGLTATVDGSRLRIGHGPLVPDRVYRWRLAPGAVTAVRDGRPNAEARQAFLVGQYRLYETSFATGLEGCETALGRGLVAGSARLRWTRDGLNPIRTDLTQVSSNYADEANLDFLASPLLHFTAGEQYSVSFVSSNGEPIHAGLAPVPDRTTLLAEVLQFPAHITWQARSFTAPATGDYHLLLYPVHNPANPWAGLALDNLSLRRNFPPALWIDAPAQGAVFREGDTIPFAIDAFGVSGALDRVEVFDGGDEGRLVASFTGSPVSFDWAYDTPGPRTFTVVATDERGETTTRTVDLTLLFADGSLDPFLHWDFDDDDAGWTGGFLYQPGPNPNLRCPSGDWAISSPRVFLFAGQTYSFSFEARADESMQIGFEATLAPGRPGALNPLALFNLPGLAWGQHSVTFTVPADGPYYLTLYVTSDNDRVNFDDMRLTGLFNLAPAVQLVAPSTDVRTVSGADIRFSVNASDADGAVSRVDFLAGDFALGSDAVAPYTFDWLGIPRGEHRIAARATDSHQGVNQTEAVTVTALRNELDISTFLGAAGEDETIRGALYQPDGTLLLAYQGDPARWGPAPVYANGSGPGDQGALVRLSEDGREVFSVHVLGPVVSDLSGDAAGRVYLALGPAGVAVLDPSLTTVLFSRSWDHWAHRVDASPSGYFVVLTSSATDLDTNKITGPRFHVFSPALEFLNTLSAVGPYNTDVCIDEISKTVIFTGFKNIHTDGNPVDIPILCGRDFQDHLVFRGYDWGGVGEVDPETGQPRHLNHYNNNMADSRGARLEIGPDGLLYVAFEFDGGNTPLRYSPFDLDPNAAVNATWEIAGGDQYHSMAATSTVPKTFLGRYRTDGHILRAQWITNRLSSGGDNTIRMRNGDFAVDAAGRVHLAGFCAAGLPMDLDFLPGHYTGGAYYLVYSPDLATRELCVRLTDGGNHHAIALSPHGKTALAGYSTGELFDFRPRQEARADGRDAYYAVGDFSRYFRFQTGPHPRLFFGAEDLPDLRDRLSREPYASMYAHLVDYLGEQLAANPGPDDAYPNATIAQVAAFLYSLTDDDAYARIARERTEMVIENDWRPWADPATKGLTLYTYGFRIGLAYDLCANAPSWDAGFDYRVSQALHDNALVIVNHGGSEQNSSDGSNWQAARGATGVVSLLAGDHQYDPALLDSAWSRLTRYLTANPGDSPLSRGWNAEGLGYVTYPWGDFVGPCGVAMARHDPSRDLRQHTGFRWTYWTIFASFSKALNLHDFGGVKPDWVDDHPHIAGEGVFGQSFDYLDEALRPGALYWYNRTQGSLATDRARWDEHNGGTIWSYLFYPETGLREQDPMEIFPWVQAGADTAGLGLMQFRNAYRDGADALAQFKVRLRGGQGGHDGPDGLGFRIIADGVPWVVGGGTATPGRNQGQPVLYPANPDDPGAYTTNYDTGTLIGTPLVTSDGGGHAVGYMARNNVGVTQHRRWFVACHDAARTGADAVYLIADTSDNGLYWQIPTYRDNAVSIADHTFTITGPGGATLRGTVLHPTANHRFHTGLKARGSDYGLDQSGAPILDNRYLHLQSDDGDFLIVLTVNREADHPAVTHLAGGVADATVQVGSLTFTLQPNGVLYDGVPYTHPDATITFAPGAHGTLVGGAAVQTVAFGGAAVAPVVQPEAGFRWAGWDKSFDQVARSMTVTAQYQEIEAIPTAPSRLTAAVVQAAVVRLEWRDRSTGETGFEVQRSVDGVEYLTVHTTGPDQVSWQDHGVLPLSTYHYRVRARGTGGDSAFAGPLAVTLPEANAPPVFDSAPPTLAHQNAQFSYTVRFSDPEGDDLTVTAPLLPDWLTLVPLGADYAVLSGTPTAEDFTEGTVILELTDGINPPVRQSFTLNFNAGPAITLRSPGANPAYLPGGVGLFVEVTATDQEPVSIAWSRISGPAVTWDDPTAAATGVRFGGDGDYLLRVTATDGQALTWYDLAVSVNGTPAATLETILDFGGDYLTTSQAYRDGTTSTASLDLDGDGLTDDFAYGHFFRDDVPLSPFQQYGGACAVFHGAIVGRAVEATGGFQDFKVINSGTSDYLNIRYEMGATLKNLDLLVYWKKASFLGSTASRPIFLDGESALRIPAGESLSTFGQARWVVRSGDQFYASQSLLTTSTTGRELKGALLAAELWAPYHPADELDFDATQPFQVPTSALDNITAVGLLMDQDTLTTARLWPKLGGYEAVAKVRAPVNQAPWVSAGHDLTAVVGEQLPLAGSATDTDGPQPLGVEWVLRSGPAVPAFGDSRAAATTAVFPVPGTYSLRLTATDGDVRVFDERIVEVYAAPSAIEAWRATHFQGLPGGINHPRAAWVADPDGDGLPNLAEFLHHLDPNAAAPEAPAWIELVEDGGATYAEIHWRLRPGDRQEDHPGSGRVDGVRYAVEWSTDLVQWRRDSLTAGTPDTDQGDGTRTVTVRHSAPLTRGPPLALRLWMAYP